eukprot:TRINITY_DN1236_c0_g1_i1.p1 TRINITY_DN1236_c0_g1~~TRINITY_DN1236_c0_g1_i1.p1  ORF type:complete len:296 (-),score=36.41 TRINITY_DN1236_c0_g1_i1:118-966(-)
MFEDAPSQRGGVPKDMAPQRETSISDFDHVLPDVTLYETRKEAVLVGARSFARNFTPSPQGLAFFVRHGIVAAAAAATILLPTFAVSLFRRSTVFTLRRRVAFLAAPAAVGATVAYRGIEWSRRRETAPPEHLARWTYTRVVDGGDFRWFGRVHRVPDLDARSGAIVGISSAAAVHATSPGVFTWWFDAPRTTPAPWATRIAEVWPRHRDASARFVRFSGLVTFPAAAAAGAAWGSYASHRRTAFQAKTRSRPARLPSHVRPPERLELTHLNHPKLIDRMDG